MGGDNGDNWMASNSVFSRYFNCESEMMKFEFFGGLSLVSLSRRV